MKNRELIGYKTITNCNLFELNDEVNRLIKLREGWELYKRPKIECYSDQTLGDVFYYTQTMVRYLRNL